MTQFRNIYDCPCGTHWTDDWDCMCDDRCPSCNTSCSPTESHEILSSNLVGTITGRMVSRNMPWKEAFKEYEMRKPIFGIPNMLPNREEGMPFDPMDFYEDGDRLVYGTFHRPSTEKDWERTRFVAGEETPPDTKKRAQLKAKRKKR